MDHYDHPVAAGVVIGVTASLCTAFCVGWAVARHLLGPSSRHHPRWRYPKETQ